MKSKPKWRKCHPKLIRCDVWKGSASPPKTVQIICQNISYGWTHIPTTILSPDIPTDRKVLTSSHLVMMLVTSLGWSRDIDYKNLSPTYSASNKCHQHWVSPFICNDIIVDISLTSAPQWRYQQQGRFMKLPKIQKDEIFALKTCFSLGYSGRKLASKILDRWACQVRPKTEIHWKIAQYHNSVCAHHATMKQDSEAFLDYSNAYLKYPKAYHIDSLAWRPRKLI